jgi:hypothetical protein
MAESNKVELSKNVTLSFLGNEITSDVSLYKYNIEIGGEEKTLYLEKEATNYDKTQLNDYIEKMVEENKDQDVFYVLSKSSSDDEEDDKEEEKEKSSNKNKRSGDSDGPGGPPVTKINELSEQFDAGVDKTGLQEEKGFHCDLDEFTKVEDSIAVLSEHRESIETGWQCLKQASDDHVPGSLDAKLSEFRFGVERDGYGESINSQINFYYHALSLVRQIEVDSQLNALDKMDPTSFQNEYNCTYEEYVNGLRYFLSQNWSITDLRNAVTNFQARHYKSENNVAIYLRVKGEYDNIAQDRLDALGSGDATECEFNQDTLKDLGCENEAEFLVLLNGALTSTEDYNNFINGLSGDSRAYANMYVNKLVNSCINKELDTEEGKEAYQNAVIENIKSQPDYAYKDDPDDAMARTQYAIAF